MGKPKKHAQRQNQTVHPIHSVGHDSDKFSKIVVPRKISSDNNATDLLFWFAYLEKEMEIAGVKSQFQKRKIALSKLPDTVAGFCPEFPGLIKLPEDQWGETPYDTLKAWMIYYSSIEDEDEYDPYDDDPYGDGWNVYSTDEEEKRYDEPSCYPGEDQCNSEQHETIIGEDYDPHELNLESDNSDLNSHETDHTSGIPVDSAKEIFTGVLPANDVANNEEIQIDNWIAELGPGNCFDEPLKTIRAVTGPLCNQSEMVLSSDASVGRPCSVEPIPLDEPESVTVSSDRSGLNIT